MNEEFYKLFIAFIMVAMCGIFSWFGYLIYKEIGAFLGFFLCLVLLLTLLFVVGGENGS